MVMEYDSIQILIETQYRVPWYFHLLNALSWFDLLASFVEEMYILSGSHMSHIYEEWLEYSHEGLSNTSGFSYYEIVVVRQGCFRKRRLGTYTRLDYAQADKQKLVTYLASVGTKTFCKQYRIPGRLLCFGK
jgi:hypothetical protein